MFATLQPKEALQNPNPGADLVIVNTYGFIDAAMGELLESIGETLAEIGKVVITGCLGARTTAKGAIETEATQASLMGENAYSILKYTHFCE